MSSTLKIWAFKDVRQIDELPDDFLKCSFLVQALMSVDWAHYKRTEGVYFELGFFIPFSVIDSKQGVQFAKIIVKLRKKQVVKQYSVHSNH